MVLELPSDDPEGGVDEVVVDVDLGESVRRPRRAPLLLLVVVDHDGGARRGDALLWPLVTAIEGEFPMVISLQHVTLDLPDLHRTHMHRKTRYFPPNLLIPRIEATVKHRLSQTGPTKDPWTSIVLNVQTLIRGQIFTGLTSVLRERFGTFSSNGNLEPYLSQRCHVQIKYRAQQISNVDVDPHPPLLPPPFRFPLPQTPLEVMKREGGSAGGRWGVFRPQNTPLMHRVRACAPPISPRNLPHLQAVAIAKRDGVHHGPARTELTEEGAWQVVLRRNTRKQPTRTSAASVFTQIRSANFWNILYSFRTLVDFEL